ncbi:MAG: copper chaperone PCu(A)C [Pelomonas sp.]|nr:copper chaperone PCu(A)C [Roseateles sp.]
MKNQFIAALLAAAAAAAGAAPGPAVEVTQAWARSTVPGQTASGVFAHFKAPSDMHLVGASTPAAGVAQIHEMKMVGDVMQMREMPGGLALPAGADVALGPGGQHIMLLELHQTLKVGAKLPLELRFVDAKGHASKLDIEVPVLALPPAAAAK